VLELALREALSLGHNYIGTEHILLGLVRENEGVAARILLDFDADAEKVHDTVIRMLGGPGPRQTDEGFSPGEAKVELRLRRVVPVAQQVSDGTWVVSVEVWDHGLVVRWATSERPTPPLRRSRYMEMVVSDDVGTSYVGASGGGGGNPQRGFHYHREFEPAPPPQATSLRIRQEAGDEGLSISLTD
jgi:Clp amino terminal domain, pathogenicity island component